MPKGRKPGPGIAAALLLAGALVLPTGPGAAADGSYDFTVYLDGKEIGRQTFTVSGTGGGRTVRIDASFDVKLLFFTAYRYRHTNEEIWEGGCLRSMTSSTIDGGEEFFVRAAMAGDLLLVTSREGDATYGGCVKSYAYWDRTLLQGRKLLNSQTGRMDRVTIDELGARTIDVRGVPTKTDCRRIVSDEFTILLWYAGEDWVALESTTAGGRRLRYAIR